MNRTHTSPGCVSRFQNPRKPQRNTKLVGLEPLEERKLLTAVTYYNDNWVNLDNPGGPVAEGDQVRSSLDSGPFIVAEYGFNAFGVVGGTSLAQFATIHSAIQNTDPSGTLNLLPGTFKESDIVIDRSMSIIGRVVSNVRTAVIVPEVTSAKADGDFPVGTRSGFIINAPNVTIDSLQIDGDGNNGVLGGSMHYHHGITSIFDTQAGGNYSSLRAGNLAPNNLSADDADANVVIRNLDVRNTYWHGITLSGTSATNMAGNRIQNVTVQNVGMVGSRDLNRVGIQIMNQIETDILSSTISNVGVGIESRTFGPASFDSNDLGRNNSGMRLNSVTNADQRAYSVINADGLIDLNFILTSGATFIGFDANKAIYTSTSNNSIGLYINNSQYVVAGYESTNAKIGVKVENTVVGDNDLRLPVFTGTTILGPGIGVIGSVGILADNVGDPTNPASFGIAGSTKISGFETGLRMNQETPLAERNRAQIDRTNLAGNGTAISIGNNSLLQGNTDMTDSVQLTGNGAIEPGFPDSFVIREGSDDWAGPYADIFKTGSVTLNSSATLDIRLAGDTGSAPLFTMNENVGVLPFGLIPPAPEAGRTTDPYGTSMGAGVNLGNGVLTVTGQNGPLSIAYGTLNHPDPNDPGWYILDPVDLSENISKIDIVVKLGVTNQAKGFIFGLVDTDGQVALFTLTTEGLSAATYSTVSINLAAPGIPFSLGDGGDFDLDKIMGWAVLGDVGLINGATNVPFSIIIDKVDASSILNSQLNVTGAVDLAGATLNLQLGQDFTPSIGQQFTIINNDGVDPISGTFAGVPQGGTVTSGGLSYTVNYAGGDGNDVVLTRISAPTTSVAGRHIFYNQSKFDGNSALITTSVASNAAIATDKVALQFSGSTTAPVSAATSYSRGINGILVDIEDAAGTLTVNDFTFKVGTTSAVSGWVNAPAPTGFTVWPGAGTGGSDRVEIIWANNAIQNTWLQVIVEGNDTLGGSNTNTGLASSDVFFFANKIGDTFQAPAPTIFSTAAADGLAIRNNPGFLQPVTNVYDMNRDQSVGAGDELVARNNGGFLTRNLTWTAPPAEDGDGAGSAVASALAATSTPSLPRVPGWISNRLATVDLNSGPVARLFTALADANTPTTRSLLLAANEVTDALGLDDSLLESLIAGLN